MDVRICLGLCKTKALSVEVNPSSATHGEMQQSIRRGSNK